MKQLDPQPLGISQVGGCHHPRSCLERRRPSTQRWSSAWSARWSALESFVLISFNLHHCCDHFWRRSDLRGMRREACFLFRVFPLLFLKQRDDAIMIFCHADGTRIRSNDSLLNQLNLDKNSKNSRFSSEQKVRVNCLLTMD